MCLQYHLAFWEENDPALPKPGSSTSMNDTHVNCKCYTKRLKGKEIASVVGLDLLPIIMTMDNLIQLKNKMELSINDMITMGMTKNDIITFGFTKTQLNAWGYSDSDLKKLGFTDEELAEL